MFGMRSSRKAVEVGFPDFFIYKICEGYLFSKDLELQFVEGNGNCLPNSIIKELDFNTDLGAEVMYTQMYLCQAAIMHLNEKWQILGSEISENIRYLYGCPDSEVGGMKIKKMTHRGKKHTEEFGFSVKDCCQYILQQGSWCNEIFIKLIASMWGCKISVLRADNLHAVTYRYEGLYDEADIILMFNGNPTQGHYSPVGCSGKNLQFK